MREFAVSMRVLHVRSELFAAVTLQWQGKRIAAGISLAAFFVLLRSSKALAGLH
jgi:hypothetical protein